MAARKNIVDVIISDHLEPALQPYGFARRGLLLRRIAGSGDAVVVGVQRSSGNRKEQAVFYINIAVVPLPWLRWLRKSDDPAALRDPGADEGALKERASSPHSGSWDPATWVSTMDQAAERGSVAVQATVEALQRFLPLLDRAELLRRLEANSPLLPSWGSVIGVRLIMYLAEGRHDDARREIDDIAHYQPDSEFVRWARAQLPA